MSRYVVAGSQPWNREAFDRRLRDLPGKWTFVAEPADLEAEMLRPPDVRAVFFLHWSTKVPSETLASVSCVNFHMTDLPYGRGGSPLQNLIAAGHDQTMLSALLMTAEFDAGPVYGKRPLALAGTAEEIYIRATELSCDIIEAMVSDWPKPEPQLGEAHVFRRRTPEQSRIEGFQGLAALHDLIRMLDAEGYPHAFLEHAGYRFEFRRSARYDGRIEADVRITVAAGS